MEVNGEASEAQVSFNEPRTRFAASAASFMFSLSRDVNAPSQKVSSFPARRWNKGWNFPLKVWILCQTTWKGFRCFYADRAENACRCFLTGWRRSPVVSGRRNWAMWGNLQSFECVRFWWFCCQNCQTEEKKVLRCACKGDKIIGLNRNRCLNFWKLLVWLSDLLLCCSVFYFLFLFLYSLELAGSEERTHFYTFQVLNAPGLFYKTIISEYFPC